MPLVPPFHLTWFDSLLLLMMMMVVVVVVVVVVIIFLVVHCLKNCSRAACPPLFHPFHVAVGGHLDYHQR